MQFTFLLIMVNLKADHAERDKMGKNCVIELLQQFSFFILLCRSICNHYPYFVPASVVRQFYREGGRWRENALRTVYGRAHVSYANASDWRIKFNCFIFPGATLNLDNKRQQLRFHIWTCSRSSVCLFVCCAFSCKLLFFFVDSLLWN
jgi:hypothetical protein